MKQFTRQFIVDVLASVLIVAYFAAGFVLVFILSHYTMEALDSLLMGVCAFVTGVMAFIAVTDSLIKWYRG